MFEPVPSDVRFPQLEEQVLAFWDDQQVYEKSLQRRDDAPRFGFYEGPPTANGMPHPGHCLTRAIKDLFPRYKTMRGYRCERKGGWDTHGFDDTRMYPIVEAYHLPVPDQTLPKLLHVPQLSLVIT